VWEVTRRENSVVELRKAHDPATRALDDARALLKSDTLPPGVAACVIPGLCRSAVEAMLVQLTWRHLLAAGTRHEDIPGKIEEARGLHELAALAYFGDAKRTADVLRRLNTYGRWAGDAFQACKVGGHAPYSGDLDALVKDVAALVERIRGER
jgi:hypothetical protein